MKVLLDFLDARTGWRALVRSTLTGKILPAGTSWGHTLGFAALTVFILQGITGLALALHYSPSAAHAYDSIRVLDREIPGGALLRGLHHYGASAMVVLALLHAVRVFASGAYKAPRELTWILGLGLLGCVIGLGFTGYLLPWDQKAYFATKVGVNVAAQTPLAGETIKTLLYGGPDLGPNTLPRFFILHVVLLPAGLALLLVLHLWLIQKHGISPVRCRVGDPGQPGKAYHPHHTWKEGLVAALVVVAIFTLAKKLGAPLEAEADPADPAYDPRPDWFFLGVFQLLKLFEGPMEVVGAFWLPSGLGLLLVLLPFLDRNPERSLRRRPLCMLGLTVFLGGFGALTVLGALDRPKHYRTYPHPLYLEPESKRGYDIWRREACLSCHTFTTPEGEVYGRNKEDAPDFADIEMDASEIAEYLLEPDSDVMPAFDHLSAEERLLVGRFVESLRGFR